MTSSTLDRSCLRPSLRLPFCWLWDYCYSFWPPGFAVNPPSDWELTSISDNAGFPFPTGREPSGVSATYSVLLGTFGRFDRVIAYRSNNSSRTSTRE